MASEQMTVEQVVSELRGMARETTKRTLLRHGIPEPLLGVNVGDLKKIQKRVKRNHELALALYDTGIYDAMYLAGLIADDARMTKKDLKKWVAAAKSAALCGSAVAWVAAGSPHGWELACEWIESPKEYVAAAGWTTLTSLVSITPDESLDLPALKKLLARVGKTIHQAPNRVRYAMNGFVIAVGGYVRSLTELALQAAEKIGEVEVDMGDTDCQVPLAADYIRKMQARGIIGKKRKTAKC